MHDMHKCEAVLQNGRGAQCSTDAAVDIMSTVAVSKEDIRTHSIKLCAEHNKIHNRRLKSGRTCATIHGLVRKPEKIAYAFNTVMPVIDESKLVGNGPFAMTMLVNMTIGA